MEDPVVLKMEAEVYLDQTLDFDEEDGVVVQTSIVMDDGRSLADLDVPLESIVDEQIDLSRIAVEYRFLYALAHEFDRLSVKLREAAERMEDDLSAIGDLFDMERGDLE